MGTWNQLKAWMYWKSKVRWMQTWNNIKLFNIGNNGILPFISITMKLVGCIVMFAIGFGLALFYKNYISENPFYLWQIGILLIVIIEGFNNGLLTGRWIAASNEEKWILTTTSLGTVKYIFFLWIDESIWNLRNSFFSNVAALLGVLLVFDVQIINLFLTILASLLISMLLSLIGALIQYYIHRRSIYLKGKGVIGNVLIPLLLIPITYFIIKIMTPWLAQFPGQSNGLLIDEYLSWYKNGFNLLLTNIQAYLWVIDTPFYLHTLLTDLLMSGYSRYNITFLGIYVLIFIVIVVLLFKTISSTESKIFVRNSKIDTLILNFFLWVRKKYPSGKVQEIHINGLLKVIISNYLTKRSVSSTLGLRAFILIILIFTFTHTLPSNLQQNFSIGLAILGSVLIPISIVYDVAKRMKFKLNFDSEGIQAQILFSYGASPDYMYNLKTHVLRILTISAALIWSFLFFIIMPIDIILIPLLMIFTFLVYVVASKFALLSSFLVPHYEFFNIEQLEQYPDQWQMKRSIESFISLMVTPVIPTIAFLSKSISLSVYITVSVLWILCGVMCSNYLLGKIYENRLLSFSNEEIVLARQRIGGGFLWKNKVMLIIFSVISIVLSIFLSMYGMFVIVSIILIIPSISINMFFILSHNNSLKQKGADC